MVFAGIFPTDTAEYDDLRDALAKLHLNDASFQFEPDTSEALGFGFRCGFLGLLHMEIIQERLEREYNLDLITTAPSVVYHALQEDGERGARREPVEAADRRRPRDASRSRSSRSRSTCRPSYVGAVMTLCEERRGTQLGIHYADQGPRDHHLRAAARARCSSTSTTS